MTTERFEESRPQPQSSQPSQPTQKLQTQGGARNLGALLQEFGQTRIAIENELAKVVVGQKDVIRQILAAVFTRGHCLLEGVPGLAKTLTVSTLAKILDVKFQRVQFTPDLTPSDITGATVLEEDGQGRRSFRFVEGPVFTNILLADEINRTPPKTQSALLQAMQEREVTVGNETRPLPEPFLVIATQNPIDQEGTYPLPEAQLDRFMFNVKIDYPTLEEEERILAAIGGEERFVDDLVAATGIEAGRLNGLLVALQIKRRVKLLPGGVVAAGKRD